MTTLYRYEKVFEDPAVSVGFRFDGGKWEIASRDPKTGRSTSVQISIGAMDQLVAAWPGMKEEVTKG